MTAKERQKLFDYMCNEHGLCLLENELGEIEHILGDKREYAKAKCKTQRKICSKVDILFHYPHLVKSIINAPQPDFE
ncbi:hypothetical protein LCGC14_2216800 [marine sediment metagenome]|uniref:Uncharacterized protein n=1 Tax=marine sediment metagenome TaxID=412755 RepID=A0A0F9DC62_9ZZZZ